jgi:hypothetical protein
MSSLSLMSFVNECAHVDVTKTTLRLYRVDAELIDSTMHGRNKQTVEIPVADVAEIKLYTGMLAPSATCYIDVTFKDEVAYKKRCFLICGHPAARLTAFEAKIAGISVTGEAL